MVVLYSTRTTEHHISEIKPKKKIENKMGQTNEIQNIFQYVHCSLLRPFWIYS